MPTQDMSPVAVVAFALFFLLAFGLRSWLHWRRTGSTGFVGLSGRVGSAEWLGGAGFVLAIVLGAAAPILCLVGVTPPIAALNVPALHAAGLALYVLGVAGTFWAQLAMGDSWRIGVDTTARTALVASGPFRWVRNPIYTAMTVATAGIMLLVPSPLALLALLVLVVGLEVHVRFVEEPYLAGVHGERYRRYAARTGRFVPGIGRLA